MIRSLAVATVAGATVLLHGPLPFAGPGSVVLGRGVSIGAAALLFALPWLRARAARDGLPRNACFIASLLAASLCGAALAGGEVLVRLALRWPAELAGGERLVSGTIVSLPRTLAGPAGLAGPPLRRFDVRVERIDCTEDEPGCAVPSTAPRRLQVLDGAPEPAYAAGQRWRWRMRLQPADGPLNPGSFDRERWLLAERIDALAGVRNAPAVLLGGGDGAAGWLDRLRQRLGAALIASPAAQARSQHGDPQVVTALALGLSASIEPRWRERLQQTGTAHLIAISGLHVGLVFAGVFALGTRLRAPWQPDLPALLAAAGYAALAGFGLPVQRALVMLAVLVLLRRRARLVAPGTTLALAALGVLLLDPLAPLSGGFWLSAGAVAVLVAVGVGRGGHDRRGWRAGAGRSLRAQGWLSLALLPVGAFAFQQVSLVSAPVNLLAIPFVACVVVPLSLLATLLVAMHVGAADAVLALALQAVAALRLGLDAAAAVPAASLVASLPDVFALALCLAVLVFGGVLASLRPRAGWLAIAPLLVLPALPTLLWGLNGRPVRGIELHVLDVGHGLAALVLTPRATVLLDTGGGRGDATRVQRTVMPYLHGLGRRRIDRLILSHLDADHAAGLPWLAARFQGLPIIAPDVDEVRARLLEPHHGEGVTACRAGDSVDVDGVSIAFLHPAAHDAGSRNDRSCVVLLSAGGVRLLFSGDIEAVAERRLVERAGRLPLNVLIAPHHGSDSSSGTGFVTAFPAHDVVFAAGRRSRWGFPHAVTRMRYKATGARLHTVGQTGSLVFRFDPDAVRDGCCAPGSARHSARRVWRQP